MFSENVKRKYNVIIERDEDGFLVADVPELEGCHTQAKTMPELIKRVKEAIELCMGEKQSNNRFVGIQLVEVNA